MLATLVPLFGIMLIPVLALAAAGLALVEAAGAAARLVRPATRRCPRMHVPGIYGWQR